MSFREAYIVSLGTAGYIISNGGEEADSIEENGVRGMALPLGVRRLLLLAKTHQNLGAQMSQDPLEYFHILPFQTLEFHFLPTNALT